MLVAISPDHVERVEYLGASFTVRRLPHGRWDRLKQEMIDSWRRAFVKAIKNTDENRFPDATPEERAKRAATLDPVYLEEAAAIEAEVVRWGVTGHEGIAVPSGEALPFTTESVTWEGESYPLVSKELMRWYRANPTVISKLYMAIWKACDLTPTEKKSLPQEPTTIETSLTVTIVPQPQGSNPLTDASLY